MKNSLKTVLIFLVMFSSSLDVWGQQVAIDLVKGEGEVTGLHFSYRPYQLYYTAVPVVGEVFVYCEASANYWESGSR